MIGCHGHDSGAESHTDVAEAGILYPGEFVCMLLLTIPPDWAGIRHDAPYTYAVDGVEEAKLV